ncbi:MAG: Hpt domain-containing protein [Clostridiales bacterium]|nr:Hpt domain-containing protein [Clostridiales bacterium]
MNNICLELKRWGCDIDGAMERFMDDDELYVTCLDSIISDDNFDKLGNALKDKNYTIAFDCAHTLKGVIANMGLTPLYDTVVKIVEPLRNGQTGNLLLYYAQLLEAKDYLNGIVCQEMDNT